MCEAPFAAHFATNITQYSMLHALTFPHGLTNGDLRGCGLVLPGLRPVLSCLATASAQEVQFAGYLASRGRTALRNAPLRRTAAKTATNDHGLLLRGIVILVIVVILILLIEYKRSKFARSISLEEIATGRDCRYLKDDALVYANISCLFLSFVRSLQFINGWAFVVVNTAAVPV